MIFNENSRFSVRNVICTYTKRYLSVHPSVWSTIYNEMKYGDIWLYEAKDQNGRGIEKEGKDWTKHGTEDRRADVSGELVRGLLGTTLALGRVITRFVSRKPPGSTQMRTVTENTVPSYSSQFLRQPDDSFSLVFPLFTARSRFQSSALLSFRATAAKQRPFHFLSLYFNVTILPLLYIDG